MADEKFRDWIPDGEETGAITENGFQDFVPAPEPKPQVVTEPIQAPQPEKVENIPTPAEAPVLGPEPTVPPLEPKEVK